MRSRLVSFVLVLLTVSFLSACATNPQEDYGRRTLGTQLDDELIESKAEAQIAASDARFAEAHIVAVSYNNILLLVGQVPTQALKVKAGDIASKVRKVRLVQNELQVAGASSLMARANDSWVTSKVKTQLGVDSRIDSGRIKIVTEAGVVYMMGLLTRTEADIAVDAARRVLGVQKIVKVFEYLD